MQSTSRPIPPAPLTIYLTWYLGQDFGGFAVIYATSSDEAFDLLDNYTKLAQPKHRLFTRELHYPLLHYRPDCVSSRHTDADGYGYHIYHIGQVGDETHSRMLLLEDGEDVRFND